MAAAPAPDSETGGVTGIADKKLRRGAGGHDELAFLRQAQADSRKGAQQSKAILRGRLGR
ncbi:hypothetical protein [Cellulomonas sp. P5_C6]